MATEILELVVRVTGAGAAASDIDRLTKNSNALSGALRFMRNALVALSFGRAALGIVQLLDSFVTMQNKLALVTRDLNEVNVATEALAQIAIRSRTPLDVTTTLFTRMARSLTTLHLTYGELLDITEATNKALVISGATTDEARNAIVQFTQGLALGVLRGQDLKSVVEFAPRLAQVLADGLSKSAPIIKQYGENFHLAGGQLYAFVTAHKNILTSKVVIEAYKEALGQLNAEFGKTTPTIQQAFTNLTTAVELFVGRTSQATGLVKGLVAAIDFIREHLNAFAEGLVLIAGLFVFNLLARQVLAFGAIAFSVFRGLVTVFSSVATAIGFVSARLAALGVLGGGVLRALLGFTLVGVVIGAVVVAFQYFGVTMQDVLSFAIAFVADVSAGFYVLADVFYNVWETMALGAVKAFNFISEKFTEFLNFFRAEKKDAFQLESPAGPKDFGGIGADFARHAADNKAALTGVVAGTQAYFDNLGKGGVTEDQIAQFRALQSALSGTSNELTKGKENVDHYTSSILNYIRQVSPLAAGQAKIAELDQKIAEAEKHGIDVRKIFNDLGLTQSEINRRLTREVLGVGNAQTDYDEKLSLLNRHLHDNVINTDEYAESTRKLRIELLSFGRDVGSGVSAALEKIEDTLSHREKIGEEIVTEALKGATALRTLSVQEDALAEARKRGAINALQEADALRQARIAALDIQRDLASGVESAVLKNQDKLGNQKQIGEDVVTEALKASSAISILNTQTAALKLAFSQGQISAGAFADSLQDIRIAALEAQNDLTSGFQLGVLQVQKDLGNGAKQMADIVKGTFDQLTNAITDFVLTGKLDLGDMFRFIEQSLVKLAVQQAIIKPLAGALFGDTGGGGGIFGGGGGGGILGGGGGAGGIGSFLFGGGGATSGLGSFLGFAEGGSFMVGGSGGTDSKFVGIRATPGERVTVETPEQQRSTNSKVEIHVHGVQDADSFHRAEGQIYARAAGMLQRAASRNG